MKYTTNLINKLSDSEITACLRSQTKLLTFARTTIEDVSFSVGALTFEIQRRYKARAKSDLKYLLGITTTFEGAMAPDVFDAFSKITREMLYEVFSEIIAESSTPEVHKAKFSELNKEIFTAGIHADGTDVSDYTDVPF